MSSTVVLTSTHTFPRCQLKWVFTVIISTFSECVPESLLLAVRVIGCELNELKWQLLVHVITCNWFADGLKIFFAGCHEMTRIFKNHIHAAVPEKRKPLYRQTQPDLHQLWWWTWEAWHPAESHKKNKYYSITLNSQGSSDILFAVLVDVCAQLINSQRRDELHSITTDLWLIILYN